MPSRRRVHVMYLTRGLVAASWCTFHGTTQPFDTAKCTFDHTTSETRNVKGTLSSIVYMGKVPFGHTTLTLARRRVHHACLSRHIRVHDDYISRPQNTTRLAFHHPCSAWAAALSDVGSYALHLQHVTLPVPQICDYSLPEV